MVHHYPTLEMRTRNPRHLYLKSSLILRVKRHLSLLMYDTVNGNVPSYLSDLFSNVCENNPYKSMLRNTEYNVVLDHVPKTE